MSISSAVSASVPLLSEIHSGIPQNLHEKAQKAKALIYEGRTGPENVQRRIPTIPQGIEEADFFQAIQELQVIVGNDHVEINDKPLVDGWYMERKFVLISRITMT